MSLSELKFIDFGLKRDKLEVGMKSKVVDNYY